MTDLSPAAQAVWDAAWQLSPVNCKSHEDRRRQQIAAALRAAADQVVPEECEPDTEDWTQQSAWIRAWIQADFNTRYKLLKIATELEGQ